MYKVKFSIVILMLAFYVMSCMNVKLIAKYDSDKIQSNSATRITYLWGIIQPRDIPAACPSKAICKVSTETNMGYIIISSVTLGIVVPQRVVWDCCASVEPLEHIGSIK